MRGRGYHERMGVPRGGTMIGRGYHEKKGVP